MRIFLSADIEGTAGIARWEEARAQESCHQYFKEQMSREVAAACRGALAAGADEVVIKDAHGPASTIIPSYLPKNVRIIRGWFGSPQLMMDGLDKDFDMVVYTGYHSAASWDGNPLAHTINSSKVDRVTINGETCSEFMINTYTAAYHNVPVVFLSGDQNLCQRSSEFVPGLTTVATLEGTGNATLSIHPETATELIEAGVKEAVQARRTEVVKLPEHFSVDLRFKDQHLAYRAAQYPGASLVEAKTSHFESEDYMEVLRFLYFTI